MRRTTAFTLSSLVSARSVRPSPRSEMPELSAQHPATRLHADGAHRADQHHMGSSGTGRVSSRQRAHDFRKTGSLIPVRGASEANVEAPAAAQLLRVFAGVVEVAHFVDEAPGLGVVWREGSIFDGVARAWAAFAHAVEPRLANAQRAPFQRGAGFRARTVAGEGFFGALELADLQKVDIHAQLFGEQPVGIDQLGCHADGLHTTGWAQPDALTTLGGRPHR